MRDRIDLNADVGEERGDDAAIIPLLSSASIACGGHAGGGRALDEALMNAARHGVSIGAHVSYEDRANFGRVAVAIDREALTDSLLGQLALIRDNAGAHDLAVTFVKPHGALYHRVATDAAHASALVDAVRATDPTLELLVPSSPLLERIAGSLTCRHEFFADRGYRTDGSLVPRGAAGARIDDVKQVLARTLRWLEEGTVETADGVSLRVDADSICIHGDDPQALALASALHDGLQASGVRITSWMTP